MQTQAVIFEAPGALTMGQVSLSDPEGDDLIIETRWSGISTGTERLLWTGAMPPFPGMGYPLVPGYETVGEVVAAPQELSHRIGETVFVPGCNRYSDVRGLFGGSARELIVAADKAVSLPEGLRESGVLMALAATAHHAVAGAALPELIIGNGVLGRLIARIVVALGGDAPFVHELDDRRMDGAVHPESDERRDYRVICDVSGKADIVDTITQRLAKGGEIILAGFYSDRINFAFPPAFMKEARMRIAAEWQRTDMDAVCAMVTDGRLSLDGLVTDQLPAGNAQLAYETAFNDAACLKMVLQWKDAA